MSTIKKVWTGTSPTHTFKDDVSGFGIFSAAQGLTPTGHTKVATISYRTFNTTTEAFGATQTVEFYSNSGSSSGNTWIASVTGTNLILNSTGGGGGSPTVLGTMPDLEAEEYDNNTDILDKLATAGILSKTTSGSGFKKTTIYTVLCNSLTITNASGGDETAAIGAVGYSGAPATITKSKGQTFEYSTMAISEGYHSQYFTQSIAAGTSVTENTDITITTTEDITELGQMPSSMALSDSETTILNTLVSADLVTLSGTQYIPNCTLVIAYRDGDTAIVSDASTRTYPADKAILLPSWKSNIPSNTYLSAFSFAPSAGTTMYGSGQIVLRYTYKASSGGGGDVNM